jgi:CIC family chloride channel protein
MPRLLAMCVVVGLVAGLGAAGFFALLELANGLLLGGLAHYHESRPGLEEALFSIGQDGGGTIRWVLLLLPAAGGLVSGLITFSIAPEAEGHGTDAAIEAYHYHDGAVRGRVPFIKAITSAITIGTGGSGGREGPIAQIGSGFASVIGRWFKVSPEERRVLMAAGMAAGVGAIFQAPFAGALFAAEVLYSGPDMEHEVFVPAFVTSILAYSVFGAIFGFHPLFATPAYAFSEPALLLPYAALGVVMAAAGWLFVRTFYGVRNFMFDRVKVPRHFLPMIGGLVVGLIGFFLPEALATGYGVVQACFNSSADALSDVGKVGLLDLPSAAGLQGFLPAGAAPGLVAALLLLVIALAKMATTAFSIGSGGSGGVFGPSVVIGGAVGGAVGLVVHVLFPALGAQPGAFALVGMAGFFAGAANTPISTIMMVSEMTGNYDLLVPAMLVCILAFVLSRNVKLYEKQLPSRLDAPSKLGYMARAILRRLTVADILAHRPPRPLVVVKEGTPFKELEILHWTSAQDCYPVVDEDGRLSGVLEDEDLRRMIPESDMGGLLLAMDLEHTAPCVTADQSMLTVVNLLSHYDVQEVVVVEGEDRDRPVATVTRGDVVDVYNRAVATADETFDAKKPTAEDAPGP